MVVVAPQGCVVRTITVEQRRRAMVRRHHLAGDADDPEAVTRAPIALHATDPASVYLSVLARSAASTLAAVADALYERRSLVRWMAMRRTLFVFAREDIPTVQAAVVADRGADARAAIQRAASHLHARLNGAAVTPAIRTPLEQAIVPRVRASLLGAAFDLTVLNAAFDAVLLDFKAADAGEIDCLVIGVATPAERSEVLGASPPLEDIDPCGVHRIDRDREVETTRCLAGEAHSTDTCDDMGVSVRWIEDEVTGDDEHPPIVPRNRYP
jgi:hypothetical protein